VVSENFDSARCIRRRLGLLAKMISVMLNGISK